MEKIHVESSIKLLFWMKYNLKAKLTFFNQQKKMNDFYLYHF